MIVALADTHATSEPGLTDGIRRAIEESDAVIHAGDFTTTAVLDAFEALSDRLIAAHGNSDTAGVRRRLETHATLDALDRRFLVVHGDEHDRTSLSLLARQEGADAVVVGHTHSPATERIGEIPVVNPGSHADPRGSRPAFATFERAGSGVVGRVRAPTGETVGAIGTVTV